MKNIRILLVAAMTAILAIATSCQKEDNAHLDTDPYTIGIENISENASATLNQGDVVTFDVVLYYLDNSSAEGYKTVLDNGNVTSIELTDGLELSSFGTVRVSGNASSTETVTVRLPHGYQNGREMIKVLTLNCE